MTLPTGLIVAWDTSITTIPDGWMLCDGTNETPDLRDKFVTGADDPHQLKYYPHCYIIKRDP